MKRKRMKKGGSSQAGPGSSQLKGQNETESRSSQLKAQYFIVGAILVCSMFFMAVPRFMPLIRQPSADIEYISVNLQRELPNALNLGLNESAMLGHMTNFTHFMEDAMLERYTNYTSVWLIAENISATGLNTTVGNFMGEDVSVTINVSGTVKVLPVPNGTVNSTSFSSVATAYNITISFSDQEETFEWARHKVNLYAFFQLDRGEDEIKNYVAG